MNVCELNKFIELAGDVAINCYQFNPKTEEATISKGSKTIVIDLTKPVEDQLSEFQLFMDGL